MTTYRATLIRRNSLPRWPDPSRPARTTGPVPGLEKGIIMCGISRLPRQPGRRGFAGQTIQDIAATTSVATGQHWPAPTARLPQGRRRPGDPPLTRMIVELNRGPFLISDARARQELRYQPVITRQQGMQRLRDAMRATVQAG